MSLVAVDTPDGQRGVVSASKLLASVAANTGSVTVTIPPNAKTMVIAFTGGDNPPLVGAVGVTTGFQYPPTLRKNYDEAAPSTSYAVPVDATLDTQITITATTAPLHAWYVYAHSGIEVVVTSDEAVPTAPSLVTSVGPITGTGVNVLNAPTHGHYYLFGYEVYNNGGTEQPLQMTVNGSTVFRVNTTADGTTTVGSFEGLPISAALLANTTSPFNIYLTLRYASGP
jgi:hypothetical protein